MSQDQQILKEPFIIIKVLFMFSKSVEVKDLNQAEVFAILKALRIYLHVFSNNLTMENDYKMLCPG